MTTAVSAAHIIKRKEADKGKNPSDQYAFELLKEGAKINNYNENWKLKFQDYSLFQWLSASGYVEIMLISATESDIRSRFNVTLSQKLSSILLKLEKGTEKIPAERREKYKLELQSVRNELNKSKTFRSIASTKK